MSLDLENVGGFRVLGCVHIRSLLGILWSQKRPANFAILGLFCFKITSLLTILSQVRSLDRVF